MPSPETSSLAHCVYFTLKDRSEAARDALIASCHKHLTDHPGTIHFSAGPRASQYQRPVNDAEFDIGLVVIFASAADHDAYQASERHKQFIAEQSPNWSKVRVFDALA